MQNFDIFFAGKLAPNANLQETREAVGRLFKVEGQALDKLFSGTPVKIKTGVDVETANRFRKAFRDAGALIDIKPQGQPPAAPETNTAAASSPGPAETTEDTGMTLLPPRTGSLEDCASAVAAREIPDISWMRLDLPGIDLDETPPPAAADIETGQLSMSAPNSGSLADCAPDIPAQPIPDISQLSMGEANSGSLEDCVYVKEGPPIPDVSHLDLVPEEKPEN